MPTRGSAIPSPRGPSTQAPPSRRRDGDHPPASRRRETENAARSFEEVPIKYGSANGGFARERA